MARRIGHGTRRRLPLRITFGLAFALLLALFAALPSGQIPVASAHALLVRSDPAADAILQAPPSQVRMWFSEDLNPQTSRAVVVDPSNREVDQNGSRVNPNNPREMDVSLPLLPAGTYVVAWRTQSAEDGHIVGGSFIFRIARPDGTVPPLPPSLPTGHFPGAAGTASGTSGSLDGPTIVQTVATWLALLFMTFWVGGLIWQTWILPPHATSDADLASAARAAARRFRQLAPYALIALIWANVGIILAQAAELAGGWSGVTSAPLLRAVLFGSRFGTFWWMREVVALAALLLAAVVTTRGADEDDSPTLAKRDMLRPYSQQSGEAALTTDGIADWRREVLGVVRNLLHLPARLVAGVRSLTWPGRAELVLGAALLVAFALSGHAAAVQSSELAYAVSVDLLHLLCEAAWVGGLFYISVVFVPTLAQLTARQRARVLALGLPEFGVVAIVSAVVLAATGSLNTTIHLTSIRQFLTTAYGQTLAVKIEFFLIMVAISAYHAFFLRPRLAVALVEAPQSEQTAPESAPAREALVGVGGTESARDIRAGDSASSSAPSSGEPDGDPPISGRARRLADKLEDWLRREAMIGGVVLLCVALLAAFAGSLTVAAPAGASNASSAATSSSSSGPYTQTQSAGGYSLTLKVTPDTFGTNTFIVTVRDTQNQPVDDASVLIQTTMLDMDMGTQSLQLKPVGAASPGAYSGQSDLTMAGHWQVIVKVLPPSSKQFVQSSFKFGTHT